MANWGRRRQGCEIRDQEVYRVRSDYTKPSKEIWKLTVPSWEKKFCSSVGAIPWHKFLENKRYVHLCKNVLDWDDSAGEEAFNNAKSRFWAKINHIPCDIPSPDPDTNIDAVDWEAAVDPELYTELELEKERKHIEESASPEEKKYVFLSEALLLDPTFSCTGWGDAEDTTDPLANNEWGDQNGWGNDFNQPGLDYHQDRWSRNEWGQSNGQCRNGGSGCTEWRHKAQRSPGNENYELQANRGNRGRRKSVNVGHQKHTLRQWNNKSCAQVS